MSRPLGSPPAPGHAEGYLYRNNFSGLEYLGEAQLTKGRVQLFRATHLSANELCRVVVGRLRGSDDLIHRILRPDESIKGSRENPKDLRGRHVPEKYLAGLSKKERADRIEELTALRSGALGYSPLPTDVVAQRKGLVRRSKYTREAAKRGIEHRGDYEETAQRALLYYGVEASSENVSAVSRELEKIFKKGLAAWQTGGHRPGASQVAWAYARVASVLVGGKAAYTADSLNVAKFPARLQSAIWDQRMHR